MVAIFRIADVSHPEDAVFDAPVSPQPACCLSSREGVQGASYYPGMLVDVHPLASTGSLAMAPHSPTPLQGRPTILLSQAGSQQPSISMFTNSASCTLAYMHTHATPFRVEMLSNVAAIEIPKIPSNR